MNGDFTCEMLCSAERAAMLSLSVYERLKANGDDTVARVVWVIHEEATASAGKLAASLGIEPNLDA